MSDKTLLRKALRRKRNNIPFLSRRVKSHRILRKLSREPVFQKAKHVAFYYGIAPEVETRPFLRKILKGKKINIDEFEHLFVKIDVDEIRDFIPDYKKTNMTIGI